MELNALPQVLLRIGGESFEWLAELGTIEECLLNDYLDLENQLKSKIHELSASIFVFNRETTDNKIQNQIQNFRRNIFNRRFDQAERELISKLMPSFKKEIDFIFDLNKKRNHVLAQIEEKSQFELLASREAILRKSQNWNLRNALLFSSQSFFSELTLTNKGTQKTKRLRQTIFSLLKYLTRLSCKTSPFSTLTLLSLGTIETTDKPESVIVKVSGDGAIREKVLINNYVLQYFTYWLIGYDRAFIGMTIQLNRTITRNSNNTSYKFLASKNSIESFQVAEATQILNTVYDKIVRSKSGIKAKELIHYLMKLTDEEESVIVSYLRDLVGYGFLDVDFGISSYDPSWDIKLAELTKQLVQADDPKIEAMHAFLTHTRSFINHYGDLTLDQRANEIEQLYSSLRELNTLFESDRSKDNDVESFKYFGMQGFYFKKESIFYSDAMMDNRFTINKTIADKIIVTLSNAENALKAVYYSNNEQDKIVDFFQNNFSGRDVAILEFYEEYFRQTKILEDSGNASKQSKSKRSTVRQEFVADFEKRIAERVISSYQLNKTEILLDLKMINEIIADMAIPALPRKYSQSSRGVFCQISEGETIRVVLNNMFQGYGKLMSRFFHLFDKEMLEGVKNWNRINIDNFILAENSDNSYYNANIHPQLLDFKIKPPNTFDYTDSDHDIDIRDILVSYDKVGDCIRLFDSRRQMELRVIDLGFQGAGRPELFTLFDRISNDQFLGLQFFAKVIGRNCLHVLDGITCSPRVVLDDFVVLQRKSWTVPQSALRSDGSLANYIIQLRQFRTKFGIPSECFVSLVPDPTVKVDTRTRKSDNFKPQYVDFDKPIFADLLERLVSKAVNGIRIEEMLPNSRHMPRIDGNRFAIEYLIQWNQKETA